MTFAHITLFMHSIAKTVTGHILLTQIFHCTHGHVHLIDCTNTAGKHIAVDCKW